MKRIFPGVYERAYPDPKILKKRYNHEIKNHICRGLSEGGLVRDKESEPRLRRVIIEMSLGEFLQEDALI